MTGKRTTPAQRGLIIAEKRAQTCQDVAQMAQERQNRRRGRYLGIVSDEQWDEALDMVRDGHNDADVARYLGITTGAISLKKRRDDKFRVAYYEAVEDAFVTFAREAMLIADGEPGYTKGSVERDKLSATVRIELAKRFARKLLGDRPMIEAANFTVNVRQDSDDLI